jgi:hypothetical protein
LKGSEKAVKGSSRSHLVLPQPKEGLLEGPRTPKTRSKGEKEVMRMSKEGINAVEHSNTF